MTDKKIISEVLYPIISAVSSLEINELLKKIDSIVVGVTKADSTGIYTLDDRTESVTLRASKQHFDIIGKLRMKMGMGITGWVAKYGKTVVIESNAPGDRRFERTVDLPDDLYESFLSVPIMSGEVIMGVINVKHKLPHKYIKEEISMLQMIGKLVGRAIEHADLLEKTRNLEEAVETQKAVNRAKGMLINKMNISENEAYHLIRKQATKERRTMREIAESVITSIAMLNK